MKRVLFGEKGGFPLEQETLINLQNAYASDMLEGLMAQWGIDRNKKYKVKDPTSTTDGFIIATVERTHKVNGQKITLNKPELIRLERGSSGNYVSIYDTYSKVATNGTDTQAPFDGTRRFGTGGNRKVYEELVALYKNGLSDAYSTASNLYQNLRPIKSFNKSELEDLPNIIGLQTQLDTHSHSWGAITGKPDTFPPSAHSHSWGSITGKPGTFPPSTHSHSWGSITGKPGTFPPSTHSHSWGSITGKPSTYKPSSHSHSWGSITGRPSTFPPSTHTHSNYADKNHTHTGGGNVAIAGKIGWNPRRVISKFKGHFSVSAYPGNTGWREFHKITHNLMHTRYVVTGNCVGTDARFFKLSCFYVSSTYCYVATSDDSSGNVSDFHFQITVF